MKTQRVIVESSQISSIGYNLDAQTIEIEFKGGAVYEYANVPPALHVQLMSAESKGSFFYREIKKHPDLYPYKKVQEKTEVAA